MSFDIGYYKKIEFFSPTRVILTPDFPPDRFFPSKFMTPNSIKAWPQDDRPREKLLKHGEQSLSNSELLAILLRTGIRGSSAVDLARRILEKFGTFRNMSHTDLQNWREFKGLGAAKLAQIKAALEIGRRFREDEFKKEAPQIKSSGDIAQIFLPQLRDLKIEIFKVAFLNSQNRIIATVEITKGTVNQATPIIREVFQKALEHFAVSLICVHNHPSGEPAPSPEDRLFTKKLIDAGEVIQVKVLDHIIIGDNAYYSFADRGELT